MGFFDIFKRKKKKEEELVPIETTEEPLEKVKGGIRPVDLTIYKVAEKFFG